MLQLTLRLLIIAVVLQLAVQPLTAQQTSFSDVLKIRLTDKGAIKKGNEVTGYYLFYTVDKAASSKVNYLLKILDNNLEQVASKSIVDDEGVNLLECAYSGNGIMLKFQNIDSSKFIFRQYDLTGDLKSIKELRIGELDSASQTVVTRNMEGFASPTLLAIPGKGFANYTIAYKPYKHKLKLRYIIDFMPDEPNKSKEWKIFPNPDSENFEAAQYMACDGNILLSNISKRKGALNRDPEYFIQAIDISTGQKLFENSVEDSNYAIAITNGNIKDDRIQLYGLYYEKDAKTMKANSLGLCSIILDKNGKTIDRQYVSWANDVSNFIPVNEKGVLEGMSYMFFHNFIKTNDGTILGVAEIFRKAKKTSNMETVMLIEDFYLFHFTNDFKVKEVKIVKKNRSEIGGYNWGLFSPYVSALAMSYFGDFDYSFTQNNSDNSLISVAYLDNVENTVEENEWIFGTLNFIDNEWVSDKITLKSASTNFDVLPAKPGYVMVIEYFPETKKIDLRLEKLNF